MGTSLYPLFLLHSPNSSPAPLNTFQYGGSELQTGFKIQICHEFTQQEICFVLYSFAQYQL